MNALTDFRIDLANEEGTVFVLKLVEVPAKFSQSKQVSVGPWLDLHVAYNGKTASVTMGEGESPARLAERIVERIVEAGDSFNGIDKLLFHDAVDLFFQAPAER